MSFGGRTRVATVPTRARGVPGNPIPSGLVYLETFTGSNGNLGTVTTDLTWNPGSSDIPRVSSNQCIPAISTLGIARAEHDTTTADMFVQCDWVAGDTFLNEIFLIGRCGDTSELLTDEGVYLFVTVDGGGECDVTIQGWSPSGSIASTHVADSPLATWRLELNGTACRGLRNGVEVISGTSALSPQPAGTRAGFEIEFAGVVIDNFMFGDL